VVVVEAAPVKRTRVRRKVEVVENGVSVDTPAEAKPLRRTRTSKKVAVTPEPELANGVTAEPEAPPKRTRARRAAKAATQSE
jgi:hypothetical protein